MAEGYLKQFAKGDVEIHSAGIETHGLNPKAIQVMKESGIDISHQTSNNVNEYTKIKFDHVITVCDHAGENCPVLAGKHQTHHHNFPDPAKEVGSDENVLDEFRRVRDMIREYCREFILLIE